MDIIEELKTFFLSDIAVDFDKDSIELDENLLTSGIIDSMGILKLVSFMESNFGIKISNEEIIPENFQDLNSLKEFVDKKI